MNKIDALIAQSQNIAQQVTEAERLGNPINNLVKQQLQVMEEYHDEFVKQADANGMDTLERDKAEVKLLSYMKIWAQKIGLSTEKYDKAINAIQQCYFRD